MGDSVGERQAERAALLRGQPGRGRRPRRQERLGDVTQPPEPQIRQRGLPGRRQLGKRHPGQGDPVVLGLPGAARPAGQLPQLPGDVLADRLPVDVLVTQPAVDPVGELAQLGGAHAAPSSTMTRSAMTTRPASTPDSSARVIRPRLCARSKRARW